MEFGTTFNSNWVSDIGALREGAAVLDESGFDFVMTGGHVLTARDGRYDRPSLTYAFPFRDPFVLYSHLAASTKRLRFRTGILILPMLPTALVAKQAADLSLITGGRFELGVGISWHADEYRAMGQDLTMRGRRLEEQLIVLKRLWTEPIVTFAGRFHDLDELGLGQLPASPIPIWVGCGNADRSLSRVARLADGWMPNRPPPTAERIQQLQTYAAEAGRPDPVGVTAFVAARASDPEATRAEFAALVSAGASAVVITAPEDAPTLVDGVRAVIATRNDLIAHIA